MIIRKERVQRAGSRGARGVSVSEGEGVERGRKAVGARRKGDRKKKRLNGAVEGGKEEGGRGVEGDRARWHAIGRLRYRK